MFGIAGVFSQVDAQISTALLLRKESNKAYGTVEHCKER
jgi:hypothetical protein